MLFARFLAENNLLIEPQENIVISLSEAEELAKEDGVDVWDFVSRCAEEMLPQIFRPEDPLMQVSLATEHRIKLERLLDSLPDMVFSASDSLGWVYQFWQSKKKEEVNRSEVKIGADEIAAVTQLFTEPYMVEFLVHNTLGAWWAGKKLTREDKESAKSEEELRRRLALPGVTWNYLRFVRSTDGEGGTWRPAAGTFDGWPKRAAEIKVLDPCCGSGHFLVAALHHLVPIRMAEEGLSAEEAVNAVLCDNLHGLEIDERCCQIAAFALAFAAWKYAGGGGYRPLPELNVACCGIGPQCSKEKWMLLAEDAAERGRLPAKRDLFGTKESMLSAPIKATLEVLYKLFAQAPILGSLINPSDLPSDLFYADYRAVAPLLSKVLGSHSTDDETHERAIAAAGIVKAADLLAGDYTLVVTNVPYLGRSKQHEVLKTHIELHYKEGKADLATAFVLRCLDFCTKDSKAALVTPQNWLFLQRYQALRKKLIAKHAFRVGCWLGSGAFETIGGAVVNVALLIFVREAVCPSGGFSCLDVAREKTPKSKAYRISNESLIIINQDNYLSYSDARITASPAEIGSRLEEFALSPRGIVNGDQDRWLRSFWEIPRKTASWNWLQCAVHDTAMFGGRQQIIDWSTGGVGMLRPSIGNVAFGREGVAVSRMGNLPAALYTGEFYDQNTSVIVPEDRQHISAIWCFCSSSEFSALVRKLDKKVGVTPVTLLKVRFDLPHWQKVAADRYPEGLPEPESNDPTQWLFHGRPEESTAPLQVSVARLLGYRWPAELDDKMRLSQLARALARRCEDLATFADEDGIVCIPSVRGEETASERLMVLLDSCGIKTEQMRELTGGVELDEWLRNGFFEEHCRLFHNRPFIWQIWDGRKRDGFHALVNYHKLAEGDGKGRKVLESLTYSYLGDWITRQKDEVKRGEGGAEDRLAAALELHKRLEAILEGEPPFDIFVRWKPLHKQPIGWEPDINDGVRLNIRPFLTSDLPNGRKGAGILRHKPSIKWSKDRGKEPERPRDEYPWFWGWDEKTIDFMGGSKFDGNRWNACHYTNRAKQEARDVAKQVEKS
jgi:hypothetical protein